MTRYLLFTHSAPLASFGTVAVGERRPTWDRPSKSQITGLVAACLGIERSNETDQQALTLGLGFAVRIDDPGTVASDYHTAESPRDSKINKDWTKRHGPIRTRADELARPDRKTILSQREFRVGGRYTICLWCASEGPSISLEEIQKSLASPKFTPYAGRKAHALMLPMAPRLVEADRVEAAFSLFDDGMDPKVRSILDGLQDLRTARAASSPLFADADAVPAAEHAARVVQVVERRDNPESRDKWRFGLRSELLLRNDPTDGGTR